MSRKEIILEKIREAVNNTNPQSEIYLFGSRARGHQRKHSDWDILILLSASKVNFEQEKLFIDALYEIEIETGEVISPLVYSKCEWEKNHSFTALYENIIRDGVRI